MVRLGDVCDILNGYAFKSAGYVRQGVRIIRISNVQEGCLEDAAPVFCPPDSPEAKRFALQEGDILMALTGHVGRVARMEAAFLPAALNQRVACLRVHPDSGMHAGFLYACLSSENFRQRCTEAARGEAQQNLSTEWLKAQMIPMPEMAEQQRIAALHKRVRDLMQCHARQAAKLEELQEARFIEIFGETDTAHLCDYAQVRSGFAFRRADFCSDGVPVIRIADITEDGVDLAHTVRCPQEFWERDERFRVLDGDLLMAMTGNPGKLGLYRGGARALLNQRVACIRAQQPENIPFLMTALRRKSTQAQIIRQAAGCAQLNISAAQISRLCVPAADAEQIREFGTVAAQITAMREKLQRAGENLSQLLQNQLNEICQ